MFWIVENFKQLNKLSYNKSCYVNIIPLNHNYHPLLTSISLIYYRNEEEDKGFVFPINHNDGFSIELDLIKEFLLKHQHIYCLKKKELLHFLGEEFMGETVIDINLLHLEKSIFKLEIPNFKQTVADYIEKAFPTHSKLNSFIPITKHYEEQEYIFNYVRDYIGRIPESNYYNVDYPWVMYCVEKQGIALDIDVFNQHYFLKKPKLSIKDDRIYTQYNLYNFTSRPTNSFNGINFAALNKSDGSRQSFIPDNDYMFEFDYDGFHLRLIADLIGYEFSNESVHEQLGRMYFNKDILTPDEYSESKHISFQQMYGSIRKEYEHIPFFQKTKQYIKDRWSQAQSDGYFELTGGRKLNIKEIPDVSPTKLFNYLIQSAETYYNINGLKELIKCLDSKKSSCILTTYDSILIDFDPRDGRGILKEIKDILQHLGFKVNVSYGYNYNELKKIK